jgi:REP element-mobilizing transposase RayT
MPRRARLDAPGTLHHVIVRGIEKRRIVNDVADRKNFVDRLGGLAVDTKTAIYAWAIMTNHAHLLLRSSEMGLSGFMRRLLPGYAVSYNRRHRRWGHLFQNRYKSIVCDEDAYFTGLVRYIHLNPLRARLVKSLSQLDRYRWSGHGVLMGIIERDWQDRNYVLNQKIDEFMSKICKDEKVSMKELKGGSRRKEISAVRNRIAIELVKRHGVALAEVARRVGVSTSAISKILRRAAQ